MLKCKYCERVYQDESKFCGDCGKQFSIDDLNAHRRENRLQEYRNNGVKEWEWGAAKQLRTCGRCLALDGKRFSIDEDVAFHEGCRCAMLPVTSLSRDRKRLGVDWFEGLESEKQLSILGRERYQLYKNGKSLREIYGISV